MDSFQKVVRQVVDEVVSGGAKQAVKYVDTNHVIRATFIGKRDVRADSIDVRLKIGVPNYLERKFIRSCIAAGEEFPVKKVQLKFSKKG